MINPQMIQQMMPMFQQNPMAMAQQNGFNIQGQNFNGPQDMAQYLMNSGQVDQNTFNQAVAMARQMGYKI